MSHNDRLENYLNELCNGLADDMEIAMDVREEMRAHIEESIMVYKEEDGLSQEDAEASALKDFGSMPEIAEDLIDANRRKMKRNARIRLFIKAALVPAALIASLFMVYQCYKDVKTYSWMTVMTEGGSGLYADEPDPMDYFGPYINEKERFLLTGGLENGRNHLAVMEAIIAKYPDNKVYHANYLVHLLVEENTENKLAAAFAKGRQIDPDNAYYDYVEAAHIIDSAIKYEQVVDDKEESGYREELSIIDASKLENAVAIFKQGAAKPEYNEYKQAFFNERYSNIPSTESSALLLVKIGAAASLLLPELSPYRTMNKYLLREQLTTLNSAEEQTDLLISWENFITHQTSDVVTLIQFLVIKSEISEMTESVIKNKSIEVSDTDLESRLQTLSARVDLIDKKYLDKENRTKIEKHKTGILASMLLPVLGGTEFSEEELARTVAWEHAELDRFIVTFTGVEVFLVILFYMAISLVFTYMLKIKAVAFVPPARVMLAIIAKSMILPIIIFLLFQHYFPWSSHQYSLVVSIVLSAYEYILLGFIIFNLFFYYLKKYIAQRCVALNIAVPANSYRFRFVCAGVIFGPALLAFVLFAFRSGFENLWASQYFMEYLFVCLMLSTFLFIILCGSLFVRIVLVSDSYKPYNAILAKSVVPFLAVVVLIYSLGLVSVYKYKVKQGLKQDTLLVSDDSDDFFFTKVESDYTKTLLKELKGQ